MNTKYFFILASFLLTIFILSNAVHADTNISSGLCENDIVDTGEECDGISYDGKTCESYGFIGGDLSCKGCIIDTNDCIAPVVPAGQFTEAGSELKLSSTSLIIIVAILIILVGGLLYFRHYFRK